MDWSYVAGFFDGEGHVSLIPKIHRCSLAMSQSVKQDAVIFLIHEFLSSQGIRSRIYYVKRSPNKPRQKDSRYLVLTNATDVVAFLERAIPFLVVKRAQAESGLAVALQTIERKTRIARHLDDCIRDYLTGDSFHVLCRRYGFSRAALKSHFRKRGVQIRSFQESVRRFHASPEAEHWRENRRLDGGRALLVRWAKHRQALQPVLDKCRQEYTAGASARSLVRKHGVTYPMLRKHLVDAGVFRH